ncbi:hypothetical protein [Nocardiopsis suaedae]|uniref:Uncharacterized protein n=1 Tax=Nocardiopsis suaedae TaxID=3018444 RepID=A0ABT4TW22_9ACTN|nr:hypothetical protein [Nocardiopsis suaedae]MDA2808882.1 hypothetical protein [Nocardiopsis suaedae]
MSTENAVQHGQVTASYFWDDGSGINGDTGAPASGEPMQEGLAASPSWPLGTEGYVEYNGKKADFFIGDRGPGDPAEGCNVLLDLDGKTFAELTGEDWNDSSYTVSGGNGHIDVEYTITKWGDGHGTEGAPRPMGSGEECTDAVSPVPEDKSGEAKQEEKKESGDAKDGHEQTGAAADGGDDGGQSGQSGTEASTVANDMSGVDFAAADAPLAAGALAMALIPALLVAVLFARRDLVLAWVGHDRAAAWGEKAAALRDRGAETGAAGAERVRAAAAHAVAAVRERLGRSE